MDENKRTDWGLLAFLDNEDTHAKSRFQRQTKTLIWKSYLQRQRRWRLLLAECLFGLFIFAVSILIAKPVLLSPIQVTPNKPMTSNELMLSMSNTILGFAPNVAPYASVIQKVSDKLNRTFIKARTEEDLNTALYDRFKGSRINRSITWIIFKPKLNNMWRFSIKSTDRAHLTMLSNPSDVVYDVDAQESPSTSFLGIQMAVSQAILEYVAPAVENITIDISLVAMPVSPLMRASSVRTAISGILLCFTVALLPPVIETQALVVHETQNKFKRALLMRNVAYSSVYVSWLMYAYMTVLPICIIGSIVLIIIFRWIHLLYALMTLLSYISVMIMLAFIMAMFHTKAYIASLWTVLFTLMATFLAELLVHHGLDAWDKTVWFILHIFIPPLGLIHGFNQFALLQTGSGISEESSIMYTVLLWTVVNLLYFALLMLIQRTIGQERAIGGQVSWKSIIFKKVEDKEILHPIEKPSGKERERLQEVDELVAKAISFTNVSKSIMNAKMLKNITFDVYRGEFTMFFAERIQARIVNTIEDLIIGLSLPDEGTVNVLGKVLTPETNLMTTPNMMGYCHRSKFLVDNLTVQEHLTFFIELCLWNENKSYISQYSHLRLKRLMMECNLENVKDEYIANLDIYFRAQLCWAIALLLEPRIIVLPDYTDAHGYISVIMDKIMQYKKFKTIIKMSFATLQLQHADRIFLFDSKLLVFGGTPAYMFFRYGREYRVRMTFRGGGSFDNERVSELLTNVRVLGATIRANLGSLIILQLPATPTANVAALVKDIQERSMYYGVTSFSISLPDSEEVCRRAINASRSLKPTTSYSVSNQVLKGISDKSWKRERKCCISITNLRWVGWKYFTFCVYYRFYLILTFILAVTTGVVIGFSLSKMLTNLEMNHESLTMLYGDVLTVENLYQKTTLIVSADDSPVSRSIAAAYVLSETNATRKQIANMYYTAIMSEENLVEYLVTRAIDSPQHYVYMYAYGITIASNKNGSFRLEALYSPMHKDKNSAPRSLARLYMALIRHFTNTKNASIQVTDDPLTLDFTPFMQFARRPPLVVMFLLIVTMSHITFIPSKEHGLIKHMQSHAYCSSPAQYWFCLYFCDLILYWLLVFFIAIAVVIVMLISVPLDHFCYSDLLVFPFLLIIYGVACVPQGYLFCVSPRATLNSMSFVIINIVLGEATILAKVLYDLQNYFFYLVSMWPQFNTGYALVKINQIFMYNSECIIFKAENLCKTKALHKCCEKCGVLQDCYSERNYLTTPHGILDEIKSMLIMSVVFFIVLLVWEYKVFQSRWPYLLTFLRGHDKVEQEAPMSEGLMREKAEVVEKLEDRKSNRTEKVNTFGESLLCANITKKKFGVYSLRNIYLGLAKGESLAVSGLKKHGRVTLIETLAGLSIPSSGQLLAESKYKLSSNHHRYCRELSIACERDSLPQWMTVYDALELLAILRGIPKSRVTREIYKYIYGLELQDHADKLICHIPSYERARIYFAAAVIGAPPVILLDECTNFQNYSVCRAIYYILYQLKRQGHAIYISSHGIESHMPITNRLGILLDGSLVDVDLVDNLIARYSPKGFTVVVHLKDEVDVNAMFSAYFKEFVINDTTDVLVNIQVLDADLKWAGIFEKMEELKANNSEVYSYIVTIIPIDYIYNNIIVNDAGNTPVTDLFSRVLLKMRLKPRVKIVPDQEALDSLVAFESKYDITKLKELPWSVIFHR